MADQRVQTGNIKESSELLDELTDGEWRNWSDEAVGAAVWVLAAFKDRAVEVLLETGALEQCGFTRTKWLDEQAEGRYTISVWPDNLEPDEEPVYRLVTEEDR